MTHLAGWFSPDLLRPLALALLHFLWQGAALAAVFSLLLAASRTATARYVLGVATLALMLAAPAVTFLSLLHSEVPTGSYSSELMESSAPQLIAVASARAQAVLHPQVQPDALLWLVEAWFAGIILLSIRTAGGFFLVDRLRRRESRPVAAVLLEKCVSLKQRLGIHRVIRFCECRSLDAPAVIGWFRPVVLLPVTALTGLSEAQLAAVIAHELAHIKRFDTFVNLFQIFTETVLFYHPAVWWVSRRIRLERENCCDDAALSVCGDAVEYARALTRMEEWRSAPSLAMAANRGPLATRVARLLGLPHLNVAMHPSGLAASFLCLFGALIAGNSFLGETRATPSSLPVSAPASAGQQQEAKSSLRPAAQSGLAKREFPIVVRPVQTQNTVQAQKTGEKREGSKESYIEGLKSAGLDNLTVDQLIAMKIHGVTPDYVRQLHQLGLKPGVDELIAFRIHGVTPEYIRDMRAAGFTLSADKLIAMKVQGVTPGYVKELRDLGLQLDADDLIAMKVQGITPDYIREIRAAGLQPDFEQFIALRVQGITADYGKALQKAGLGKLGVDDLIAAKVQGITPEFIEKALSHGFRNLSLEKLIALKLAGVL
jgi:beta-lactamase regulating signal transducer with metallopeptidase domain